MFFVFLSFLFLNPAPSHAIEVTREYTDEICDDDQKIASEFIELELAGQRWQGVIDQTACMKQAKVVTVGVNRIPSSDPSMLDPEYLLKKGREVHFQIKKLPNDLIEVILNYIGSKNGKDVAVTDRFTLQKNYGKARMLRGCASFYSEPEHFVMRAQCWSH